MGWERYLIASLFIAIAAVSDGMIVFCLHEAIVEPSWIEVYVWMYVAIFSAILSAILGSVWLLRPPPKRQR